MSRTIKHYVIPDCQIRPGDATDFLDWIAADIVRRKPNVIVCIGDFWDLPSMSSYSAPGGLEKENSRLLKDIESGREAMARLTAPIWKEIKRLKDGRRKQWNPRWIFTFGNHENRIDRLKVNDARFEGVVGTHLLDVETFGWERYKFEQPVEVDGVWYCLEETHKVLTKDLRYVPLKDIKVGDELLAFDERVQEGEKYRKYRSSVVEEHGFDERQLYKVTLSNGKQFLTTGDHRWLGTPGSDTTPWTWVQTCELRQGSQVVKCLPEWGEESTYAAGYIGGVLDGEGHISKPNSAQGGIQLAFAQRSNACLGKALKFLGEMGIAYNLHEVTGKNEPVYSARFLGTSGEKLAALGRVRPARLIAKFEPEMLGRVQRQEKVSVASVEPADVGRIVKIKTSTGTMVVEGYAHHNCHYWKGPHSPRPMGGTIDNRLNKLGFSFVQGHEQGKRYGDRMLPNGKTIHGMVVGSCYLGREEYRGPQGVNEWRGVAVLHDVRDGDYEPMFLTLRWLCREYTGEELPDYMNKRYPGRDWSHLV